ncbi:MAG: D-inositol-3-phosphate glycosyltransferase [Candidatus Nanopelagicales bacterium]
MSSGAFPLAHATGHLAHPRRVALLSIHTSPLDQPGTGDAGGMNVYVVETAKRLALAGTEVEIFTRATSSEHESVVDLAPGVKVRHLTAGPFEGLRKEDLPGQLCAVTAGLLRVEASHPEGWFDLIHSHYWLSGQVGWLASERWNVPLVHTMHTMAKVKNLELADGDIPEPPLRVIGEEQVVAASTRLIANTGIEARQLIELYDANPAHVDTVHPGVDLELFTPGDKQEARVRLMQRAEHGNVASLANVGNRTHELAGKRILLFVGRIQPLKAPDILVRAAARMVSDDPSQRDELLVVICGGPSGNGLEHPTSLIELSNDLGISDIVRFEPPNDRATLVDWFRAADITVVPSYSESFGLVAVESQACGTPVVASAVGGLRTAVNHDVSGVLIDGHSVSAYAHTLSALLRNPIRLEDLAKGARMHAATFGWESTTVGLLDSYRAAIANHRNSEMAVHA